LIVVFVALPLSRNTLSSEPPIIAVEKYADTRIRTVKYAEADAEGFAKALETMASLFSIPASHFPILTVFAGAAFFSF